MTTFKNNSKYAELVFTYLELSERGCTPVTTKDVLQVFCWQFKGGSLKEVSAATRLKPATSLDIYPHGSSLQLAEQWPFGEDCGALRAIVRNRLMAGRIRNRAVMGRLGTYIALTSSYGNYLRSLRIYSGMTSVYHLFGVVWDWAALAGWHSGANLLEEYTKELLIACGAVSKVHVPTAETNRAVYWQMLEGSRFKGLIQAVIHMKDVIRAAGSRQAQSNARHMGLVDKVRWEHMPTQPMVEAVGVRDLGNEVMAMRYPLGPLTLLVFQECVMLGTGELRYALGKSDMERLHQMLMSAASAIVGVCAQASVGTELQRRKARVAVDVAQANISRIVKSSRLVPLGDEVLVCKGYRRAYTAHLGWLAGPLCRAETAELLDEAEKTAAPGVLDIDGFTTDARMLDATSSLNAAKMFKICPAPDVSPGLAMMDRVAQIGDGNIADPKMMPRFEAELTTQILRAYIRSRKERLKLKPGVMAPTWYPSYLRGEYDNVPSADINTFLAWEGTATVPDISPYDPKHWKDSGLGADSLKESRNLASLGKKANMITRLIYDEECPMPGRQLLNDEHVIKFFIKAEGHKDPARGIFSANLTDRQAQSWMERCVEKVAIKHPSFMIGQEVDVREAKVQELTARPSRSNWVSLFYSFDISGWSAKMPGEPQRISHAIWAKLYGGHLFSRASLINEDAHVYLNMDGYLGWYRNTHSNLEGFNGKEMTMVLIALLSLSVARWRIKVVKQQIMTKAAADTTTALLFAYIDDGLSRIDLPKVVAVKAFNLYKETVIATFHRCGFTVEVSKCFPSDRFAIFLNEVYLAGRHVVHGVRAAMGISAEPTERHTSLIERVGSVATGVRGAVMAGLNPESAVFLMAYHTLLHLLEWVSERDPVILSAWSVTPRSWGGLGLPNILQLFVSGSGSAFEEGVATLQRYSDYNYFAKRVFTKLSKTPLSDRTATSVLTAPLSGRFKDGYMIDTRVAGAVRNALRDDMGEGRLSSYAMRLLKYADDRSYNQYAECVIPLCNSEVLQEQMLDNIASAHPHIIFSSFARRLEKSMTVRSIVGREAFNEIINLNRKDAAESVLMIRARGFN